MALPEEINKSLMAYDLKKVCCGGCWAINLA